MPKYIPNEDEVYYQIYDALEVETCREKIERHEHVSQLRKNLEITNYEYLHMAANIFGIKI